MASLSGGGADPLPSLSVGGASNESEIETSISNPPTLDHNSNRAEQEIRDSEGVDGSRSVPWPNRSSVISTSEEGIRGVDGEAAVNRGYQPEEGSTNL